MLSGKDVIGLAQTGSGKTGAFAIPILQALLEYVYDSEPKKGRRPDPAFFACVLSPTRYDSLIEFLLTFTLFDLSYGI